jgi:ribonucleoside-diphosphate reductase alpha chain
MQLRTFRGDTVTVTVDDARDDLLTDFGKQTLRDRYLLPGETFQGMFARVAAFYADDQDHAQRLYDAISQHWFMPATPILSNGGTNRGNPISCFLNSVDDSLESIAEIWNENVWLAARGGGIGTNWSNVRSIGEKVGQVGETSGIIPFIKVQDSLTLGISQGSQRRGSAAVYLDVSHPEIEEFLEIRKPTGDSNRRSLNIHHGVTIPDAFMELLPVDGDWDLVSPKTGEVIRTVKARVIWQKLLEMRLQTGEPYIVWTDTVNRKAPLSYKLLGLKVTQSNLCSEIALHTGLDHLNKRRTAVCCLSSLNMATMDEWFGNEQFIRDYLLFLDNVIEDFIVRTEGVQGFEAARYAAYRERSIGAGVMGFVSYLQSKNIPLESAMAKAINLRLWKWLRKTADKINLEVARERGACPDSADAVELDPLATYARWTHMFSIAPTASISIIAGTVTPSVEPYAANVQTQKTLSGSFEVRNPNLDKLLRKVAETRLGEFWTDGPDVYERAVERFVAEAWDSIRKHSGSVQHLPFLTDDEKAVFKTWFETDQRWMIAHAADRAPYICQMASNNLAIPADVHKRDLHWLHFDAWRKGVPSLYYLRSMSLQRATHATNVAGEMPLPKAPTKVVLREQPPEVSYDECLACQ